jgi:hypothetical protein
MDPEIDVAPELLFDDAASQAVLTGALAVIDVVVSRVFFLLLLFWFLFIQLV